LWKAKPVGIEKSTQVCGDTSGVVGRSWQGVDKLFKTNPDLLMVLAGSL